MERRKARQEALELLYQKDLTEKSFDEIIKVRESLKDKPPLADFTYELFLGVTKNLGRLDKIIGKYADNWTVSRMPYIDRNIIRISLYELIFKQDIPHSVSINEAVEMAKKYGTDDSSKFINGVLGKIANDIENNLLIRKEPK